MQRNNLPKLSLFPLTSDVDTQGHLRIGGCDTVQLAQKYGTPLYILDEFTLRHKCREFHNEFARRYPNTLVIYASKAFLNPALAVILKEEGLGLDVVSGGEMSLAQIVDFPGEKVYFHGNNKTADELKLALDWKVGRIVVDNFHELELLNKLAHSAGVKQDILLRLTPGVDPHTHHHTTTGILDSKFGFPLATGQAEMAVTRAIAAPHLHLKGFHFHLGSPIPDTPPFEIAISLVLNFASEMRGKYEFELDEFSPGGGFAVKYMVDSQVPSTADYAEAITTKVIDTANELGLTLPKLIIEPGRAIVGQAGIAVYTVGAIKEIPGVRTYICVDGGIGDNIRPTLYDAKYEALVANKVNEDEAAIVTIAGRYCESGDILARDVTVPPIAPGDIIAMPLAGAYSIPMSSNYNMVPRPAIVMVREGKARLIRQRESYQDLMRLDVI
ncbi:MAG TPA: diaminopimelate decarboxylase [Dehalococcoidia bacterium]|nr:diaminopimelate decarboxylase [Dehalococcoidia bacterium]